MVCDHVITIFNFEAGLIQSVGQQLSSQPDKGRIRRIRDAVNYVSFTRNAGTQAVCEPVFVNFQIFSKPDAPTAGNPRAEISFEN